MRNPGPHGLCNGDHPWRQAPPDAGRPLKHTGEPFGGAGVLAQWSTAKQKGFRLPTWMTFPAVREHGGRLLGGTAPVTVFHGCTRPVVTVSAETGEGVVRTVETWRPYTVFNVEEVEGLPRHLYRSYREIRPASHRRKRGLTISCRRSGSTCISTIASAGRRPSNGITGIRGSCGR